MVSPQSVLDPDAKVSELINEERGARNRSLVNRTFLSFEAETILGIPLSPLLPEDGMIWENTIDGKFTIRSAYKLALERNAISKGESSNTSNMKTLWNRIWKAEVPGKVKNFMWRACKNILPTKLSLFRRQLAPNDICQECGSAQESTGHVLCLCERAKEAWNYCHLGKLMCTVTADFIDVFWRVCQDSSSDDERIELIMMVAWKIWANRNEVRHGGP